MKAVFISYNQALTERVMAILDNNGARCLYWKSNAFTYSNGRSHQASVRCMKDEENR